MKGYVAVGTSSLCFAIGAVIGVITLFSGAFSASALPSYARQTGQQCAACHNGFPELTPYGRLFKLNGYVFGGGQSNLPPLALMVIPSFTHTESDQAGGAGPHYGPNNNFAIPESGSLFYGGSISSALGIGAFSQATYDHVNRRFGWDNTDIRFAKSTTLGGETLFGLSVNNNPSVTDVWNSTPAWGYPFLTSPLAPAQSTTTMIEGAFAQRVVGLNGYTMWNRLVYAEFGVYSTLTKAADSALGVANPNNTDAIKGLAPYWRLAFQPQWGPNSFEIGVFGMAAAINPGRVTGFGTDHKTDVGFDTQYQYLTDQHSFSLQASWITENQTLTSTGAQSLAAGNPTNTHDHLRSLHAKTSYYFQQTYGATIGYFRTDGSGDPGLYSSSSALNSPNTTGWIGELDYMPFNHGGPDFWPWLNMKLGIEYVRYSKFDGAASNFDGGGRNAHNNNTLFVFDWIAF